MSDFLERISKLSPKRLALLAADLQDRVDALERQQTEPIAIVGMACRFPGGANNPEAFWDLLRSGTDAVQEVPASRWSINDYFDPNPDAPGKMSTRWGGFLGDVSGFDPHFFNIAPREAVSMDPQQRLLLEVSWEAIEDAGLSADRLSGSPTGVFIGICNSDYSQLLMDRGVESIDAYLASGTAHSIAAGRLSYTLGLHGPSLAVDTACSSSLVALHYACLSLRSRECRAALAGGVNLILKPDVTIALSKAHMMAPDGRCKTFAGTADGFVRGEGCGLVVLKRLSDAEADGDTILAIIRGTAVNQDGRSNGLTAPNGPAQEAVIRSALTQAGVQPTEISYVEAHGTGTSLGDPIEVRALSAVLGVERMPTDPVLLGSVKTNVGHLESAAGIAGLIKLVLMLRHGEIPPHLHLTERNPFIAWDSLPVEIPTTLTPWNAPTGKRIAGLSSFGFSGTNAHVVVEQAPTPKPAEPASDRPAYLVTLSGRSDAAADQLVERYAEHLHAHPDLALADVARTANLGRAHLTHRRAVVASSTSELATKLGDAQALMRGVAREGQSPEIAFLYTGQGAQYPGAGKALYASEPVFRRMLDVSAEILRPLLAEPLLHVMFGEGDAGELLNDTAYTQPATFALEAAVTELWRSWGIEPTLVIGHSVGEYVAAWAAGALSFEDGLTLIAARGRLMSALPRDGMMAAVFADEARVREAVHPHSECVSIAAVNGPTHVVISGQIESVQAILDAFAAVGIKSRPLKVSHAFHSPLMDPILDSFEAIARGVATRALRITLISNLTGASVAEAPNAGYWRKHVRQAVRFSSGIEAAWAAGARAFVEVGPAPVLLGLGHACLPDADALWLPSLRPAREEHAQILESLGSLYVSGATVRWEALDGVAGRRASLPTYPFQRERYWFEEAPRATTKPMTGRSVDFADWLYEVNWAPARQLERVAPAFEPVGLADKVDPAMSTLRERYGLDTYRTFLPGLNAMSAGFVVVAFAKLGLTWRVDEPVTAVGLMQRLGILDRHRRLVERLLAMLGEDGWLERETDGWRVLAVPTVSDPKALADELVASYPTHRAELKLTIRCAEQLAEVLRGEADPLQLLFPGGSLADTEDLYQNSPSARFYNTLIQETLTAALQVAPAGQTLRILEIGGGTGGTTSYLLPNLPAQSTEYVFTDVSPLFTRQAEQKFAAYPFVRYQVLDIGQTPTTQGFEPKSFDLIVAANVLHATADLRRTLEHVRSLLAPGGMLMLLEGTAPQRFGDLTVGLTEGWWSFTDTDLRPDYALLSQPAWLGLLSDLGFSEPTALPRSTEPGDVLSQQAVLLARMPVDAATPEAAPLPADRWLILADRVGRGRELAEHLIAHGAQVTVAYATGSGQPGEIDPADPAAVRAVVEQALSVRPTMGLGVVDLWPLNGRVDDVASLTDVDSVQTCGAKGLLHLTQALASNATTQNVLLWVITEGAQAVVAGEPVASAQAPVWGMCGVIAQEHPELHCRRLDLDPATPTLHVQQIMAELSGLDTFEDQVARRSERRLARRLGRSPLSADALRRPTSFRADATYLITGGLSGLGLLLAEWMIGRGARHLVLLSRRGATAEVEPRLQAMRANGAEIIAVAADVAEEAQLAAVLADIDRSNHPLAGVFHCAGVLDDGTLQQLNWDRYRTVFRPKVDGAWNLHSLTRAHKLDHFVLFSSGGALLGIRGQSNHSAANAFLDALAHQRRALGLPGVSLNWGAWAEIGSVVTHNVAGRMATQGLGLIPPSRGMDVLDYALAANPEQMAVIPVNWPTMLNQFANSSVPPMLLGFATAAPVMRRAEPSATGSDLKQRLASAAPANRREILEGHIRKEAGLVLGVNPAGLDPEEPLQQLGLDSLMAVELRNRLGQSLGQALPATVLFDHPSIHALVDHLGRDLVPQATTPTTRRRHAPLPAAPAPAIESGDLSEDDLARMLADRLKRLG